MKSFFSQPEKIAQLLFESERWIGTPFAPHAAICGAGVDCVNLVGKILIACGHASDFKMPKYVMDGGKHNATSQLTDYLDSHPCFARVEKSQTEPGDVLCFILGRSSHHCGQMLTGKNFIHALFGRKVSIASLSDKTFSRALFAVYRPIIT